MRLLLKISALMLFVASSAYAAPSQTAVLDVKNMTCTLCPVTVKKALLNVDGVEDAKIDFEHKTATVKFDAAKANTDAMTKATTNAGYPSTLHQ